MMRVIRLVGWILMRDKGLPSIFLPIDLGAHGLIKKSLHNPSYALAIQ